MESKSNTMSRNNNNNDREERLPQFDVPCEQNNITTHYKVLYQDLIGNAAYFKVKYQADYFPHPRQRYSLEYLAQKQNQK